MNKPTENPTDDPKLTLEYEKAVRSYVLGLLAPIAGLTSLFTFFLGYLLKDAAFGLAYSDAFKQVIPQLSKLSSDAGTASATAVSATV